jgi:hypothetical protein
MPRYRTRAHAVNACQLTTPLDILETATGRSLSFAAGTWLVIREDGHQEFMTDVDFQVAYEPEPVMATPAFDWSKLPELARGPALSTWQPPYISTCDTPARPHRLKSRSDAHEGPPAVYGSGVYTPGGHPDGAPMLGRPHTIGQPT